MLLIAPRVSYDQGKGHMKPHARRWLLLALAPLLLLVFTTGAGAATTTVALSPDPYDSPDIGQHHTEVEPDTFADGSTLVSDYQVGRINDGGAAAAGYSTDNGGTWSSGLLPGMTTAQDTSNLYSRVSDPAVAYDQKDGVWLASVLAFDKTNGDPSAVIVDRSTDGGLTWSGPVAVRSGQLDLDKDWIVCDNHPLSTYYGTCYSTWDDNNNNDLLQTATSTDGGLTWSAPKVPVSPPTPDGLGGQPLVQPNGTLIVPAVNAAETEIVDYTSSDGGQTYSALTNIASAQHSGVGPTDISGNFLRTVPLPSAEIDAAGTVYVVWQSCVFRTSCASNDIVMSSSSDGTNWTSPIRVPIDSVTSTADHFIPGIAVDPSTSSNTAHIAISYYYYPDASCTSVTCDLDAGIITSQNGGATWDPAQQIAGPMKVTSLPTTTQGRMVGDYISTSFLSDGTIITVIAVAQPQDSNGVYDERMEAVVLTPNATTARVARLRVVHASGKTTVRWFSPSHVLGFDVYAGTRLLNRRPVTGHGGWYTFRTHGGVRHVHVEAVLDATR
jgi:hypothetical protein